jgi:hypothetical protein
MRKLTEDEREAYRQEANEEAYDREQQRNYRLNASKHPHDLEYMAPEGYCPICMGFTTQINSAGECRECGTKVCEVEEEE